MAFPAHWRKGKPITAGGEFAGDPGELCHRVTLQRKATEEDRNALNEDLREWVDVQTVWAKVEELDGREFWQGEQSRAEISHNVTIRYYPGVRNEWRLQWGERVLHIASIGNPDGVKEFLKLRCSEEAGATPNRGY